MLLKTPEYDLKEHPEVYEPSEDTFLFLDALEKEMEFLTKLGPTFAAEIGSGSGVLITALASFVNCVCFATDINADACKATIETAALNGISLNCVNMDLLCNFRRNLFDVILFNPPYVITDPSEMTGCGLNRAWAGGAEGRQIIDRILHNLSRWLSDKGVCYMVLLRENNIKDIESLMYKNQFQTDLIMERRIRGEYLYIVKYSKL